MDGCLPSGFATHDDINHAARAAERRLRKVVKLCGGIGRTVKGTWTLVPRRLSNVKADLLPLLPPDGEIRLVAVTDVQLERSENFWGKPKRAPGGPA
jgi:hypothetical protein